MLTSVVILAAGQGTRMRSALPKVLHPLGGKPLLQHVIETALQLTDAQHVKVVVGHEGDNVKQQLAHLPVEWVIQNDQLGTGHAVQQAVPTLSDDRGVIVLYGDVPLISVNTLKRLCAETPSNGIGLITAHVANPYGLGRIVRDENGAILKIIEEKDATVKQRAITEINSGIYYFPAQFLKNELPSLTNHNAQKEYYLTDMIPRALLCNHVVYAIHPDTLEEIAGVNDRVQLAKLERYYQYQCACAYMLEGVTIMDPHRFDARGDVTIGQDSLIDVNAVLEGTVRIGKNCLIGSNVVIRNTVIGDNVVIRENSVIEGATISFACTLGPFARLRPGSVLAEGVHIGNFVEIKNSHIGTHSKVNHLTYIGDCDMGEKVNIGAGTITCNYDGVNKHRTTIGAGAFIGSNSQLVAPVTIGEGATIGAGSTITRNAPAHQLTFSRAPQRTIDNWQRPTKEDT